MKPLLHIVLLIAALALLAACSVDDDPHAVAVEYRYDFVTYLGNSGDTATFTYLGRGDSAAITLRGLMARPAKVREGQRGLLHYAVIERTSATARWVQANYFTTANVASDSLRVSMKPIDQYSYHPIRLRSLWLTGDYLNLRCEVQYTTRPRAFYLMADAATVGSDTVHCYLVHDLMGADTTYQWRNCYGSFWVGALRRRPACRVMRVHVADEVKPAATTYDFDINN